MAPTDEKTEVVLPAEVPDDLPLPSDQKAGLSKNCSPRGTTMEDHEIRRKIIREWMALPKDKRQTEEQVAAFAKKAVQQNEFHRSRRDPDQKFRRDPFEKVMGWLLPRAASRDRAEQRR
jgi:hypothetical protein